MAGAAATTTPEQLRERLGRIKHVVLVLSGKGGVGKSTVAVEMACALARGCEASADGGGAAAAPPMRVGLLDLDLCGPSVPHLLKLDDHSVHQSDDGWLPVIADPEQKVNLSVMSIGFLVGKNDPVIWRGPKKTAMVQQFIADVSWDVDVLVIDTPPGTSDEHISVVEALTSGCSPDGAVLVTTPQGVSLSDVRREASFCVKAGIPVLGVVENMSGFVCPHCSECTNIFATGGGEKLAADIGAPFFGRIPIDPSLQQSQRSLLEALPQAAVFDAVQTVAANLRAALARKDQSGGD